MALLEKEGVAFDIGHLSPMRRPGFAIWAGATIETSDMGSVDAGGSPGLSRPRKATLLQAPPDPMRSASLSLRAKLIPNGSDLFFKEAFMALAFSYR